MRSARDAAGGGSVGLGIFAVVAVVSRVLCGVSRVGCCGLVEDKVR